MQAHTIILDVRLRRIPGPKEGEINSWRFVTEQMLGKGTKVASRAGQEEPAVKLTAQELRWVGVLQPCS